MQCVCDSVYIWSVDDLHLLAAGWVGGGSERQPHR